MSYRPQNNHDGLWWEIALGIFVGQLMTAALAGVVALCLGYFTLRSATDSRATTAIHTPLPARRASKTATATAGIGRTMHSAQAIPQTVERLAGVAQRSMLEVRIS